MADSCKNLAQTGDFLRDHDGGMGGGEGGSGLGAQAVRGEGFLQPYKKIIQ